MVPTTLAAPQGITVSPRGPVSEAVLFRLTSSGHGGMTDHLILARQAALRTHDIVTDDDLQVALFFLYASAYGSLEQLSAELEWDPALIQTRRALEEVFERELRCRVATPKLPSPRAEEVA